MDTFYRTTKSTGPASGIISELLQRVPPFVYSIFNVRYKILWDYRVPPLIFFRHCATFFRKFLMSPKGPPLSFLLFCNRMHVWKSKRVPSSTFFGTVRHFPKEKFFSKISVFFQKNVLRFLSLRYSADFRRSRLVTTNSCPTSNKNEIYEED